MSTNCKLTLLPSAVAVVTFDVADSKVNVLSAAVMAELDALISQVESDSTLKGLVFISGKKDNFFAGANLQEIVTLQDQFGACYQGSEQGKALFARIAALKVPTVAAINGICFGGGLELALACRYRIASDSDSTKLRLPEVGLGFLPGWGGSVRLPKLIGLQAALGIILQPLKSIDGRKAWKLGLVDEVVPAAELQARAEAIVLGGRVKRFRQPFAARLSRRLIDRTRLGRWFVSLVTRDAIVAESEGRRPLPPHLLVLNALKRRKIRKGNFPAPYGALKVALAALTSPEPQAFALESTTFAQLATTEVSRNLVGIFFATEESKKAPLNARATITVKKVGVAGAGVMGAGIAQAALYAGYEVVLYDKFPQGLEKGVATIKGLFAGLVEKGKLTQERVDAILANLSTTTDTSGFVGCDLVVEAIVEDMGAKKAFLAELDRHVGKEYIFATNTSSLSVSEMAAEAAHPENTGGLHFFNPVHKMPLVEVVAGRQTSNATIAALKTFAGKLGKTPVTTADAPGFVVNRILAPYLYEAIVLMEQGVPLKDIEDAMRRFGMPMGPLALLDEVGLDIATKVIHVLNEALGARLNPPAILEFIQTNKLLGKKGGKGIYLYDERGKRLGFNPEFVAALPAANTQPMDQLSIQRRLVLAMVNEAARCLEEGVIDDPAQLDLAMLFGTGFPPFRGGVLRYADSLGCALVAQNLEWLSRVHGDNYKPSAYLLGKARAGSRFYA